MGVGGAENLLVDIVNEQVKSEKVSVIVINDRIDRGIIERLNERVEIICLNRKEGSKRNVSFILKLWYFLLLKKPRVIHCHNHNVISLLPGFRKKAAITIHDVGDPTENLRKFKKVFSISDTVFNDLRKDKIDSTVIKNGIRFDAYNRRADYTCNRNGNFKMVQISRLVHKKKGQDILLKALEKVIYTHGIKNISVDFIGTGTSEEYLHNLARQLKLTDIVRFIKAKDRTWIEDNLSSYDVLVQPSRYEGFGLTVIEGIAAGIPVIASNIDGPAEILQEVPSGFLFEVEDVNELAASIIKVMEFYEENEIEAMCLDSYDKIKEKYSVATTAKTYLENYLV
jgi:glycosyltransferase involved in cell wall biosynthesis